MTLILDAIDHAIAEIAAGRPVVVVDDADRENEGDLVMAASKATPEEVAFMIRHTSGILCVPVTRAEARRLQLWPMVADNHAPLATAFTVSVDYRPGLTTGISAAERCATVRALANPNAAAEDFVRPGHVFPLIARDGGVLMRTGHTEAAVDLARLALCPRPGSSPSSSMMTARSRRAPRSRLSRASTGWRSSRSTISSPTGRSARP
jgi:3,4-dihydroxy 2-butanone 4-phosphate synthase/GTP cyclohydrolase II